MGIKLKSIGEALLIGAQAYAKWDYETSMRIIKSRRRLAAIMLMALLPIAILTASAEELPKTLGGKEAYAPVHSTFEMLAMSIFIGFIAGLVTGCIGVGGGFIITPALMSVGVKGILAVGTDQFHIFTKSIMGTVVHKKLGNVCIPLALTFVVGTVSGATVGGTINRAIYYSNPILSDIFINIVYVILLGFLGFFALGDYLRLRKRVAAFDGGKATNGGSLEIAGMTRLAMRVQSVNLPPMIAFDHDLGGRRVSAWFVVFFGFIVGFISAIMGVGGGFLTFPIFVYVLGVSSFTTVGTDIFQIIITTGYSSIVQYAIYGFVFYTLAMGLLLGSLIGIQIGSLVTKVVKGMHVRGFYATVILAGFVNRLFALPSKLAAAGWIALDKNIAGLIDLAGLVIFFAIVITFAVWVFSKFMTNLDILREG
uniref:Probable membrane transporter protein n=1 Tax=Archaeoglobus fulgidus TaxID=2234 RepID=A0A7J2TJ69_ARCFL